MWLSLMIVVLCLVAVAIYDITQRKHAILRNFPVIGHLRYWLEMVGPELRQYIVTDNDEERPFTRDQRRWVYASSKQENEYFGFGSDNEMELATNYLIIKHSAFPLPDPHKADPGYDATYPLPCAKILGGHRQRAKQFRPNSVVNISGMSYGSLSAAAVQALNQGAKLVGCTQNTGEGGLAPHHLQGGDLVFQIGTGYFSCRELDGQFSLPRLLALVQQNPQIRTLEIKLSQGAKPGAGGILPAAKVTPEIAKIRGVALGKDVISPSSHSAFHNVDSLLDFVEQLAAATGLPVGIKSAVGESKFWRDLARLMATTRRGVDFITIDGGEGGTGAGPLVFTDHVALPFKIGFSRVYHELAEYNVQEKVVFIGSGKLGLPENALFAFGLGCDMVNVGREALLSIGCIQSQRCHTGRCPTGVTTNNPWLMRGLDPALKSVRLANYIVTLRKELTKLSRACGVVHPAFVTSEHFEILDGRFGASTIDELFDYRLGYSLPSVEDQKALQALMQAVPLRT